MNQQGPSSNVPVKRKRGRPPKDRKGENVNMPMAVMPAPDNVNVPMAVMPAPDNVLNSNPTTGTGHDEMVGKAVTGVIEATFNDGYLLNVKVENTDDLLRGVVFLPGQVAPITVENDVAPHAKMIVRKEIPNPDLNPHTEVHGSVPSLQCDKQSFEPELPLPMSEVPNPQAEIHGSVDSSVQCNKQSERILNPQEDIHGSVPLSVESNKQIFEPELPVPMPEERVLNPQAELHGSVSSPVQSNKQSLEPELHVPVSEERVLNPQIEMDSVPVSVQCNKQYSDPELQVPMSEERVQPTDISSGISVLLDNQSASTSTLIPISSGGVPQGISEPEHVSQSASIVSELDHDKTVKLGETLHEPDSPTQVKESSADGEETKGSGAASEPSIENTNKELRTEQQALPHVHQLNEVIHDEPNFKLNLIPLSAEPEALPCEPSIKTLDYFVEKQKLPKTDVVEDTETKLTIGTSSNVDTSTSNARPSTDVVNIPGVGSSHALEISPPESMPSEQTGQSVPSESKFSFEEDSCEKRDP